MSQGIVIVGAGGHGQVVADILQRMHVQQGDVIPLGFVDDDPALERCAPLGLPVLGPIASLANVRHDAVIVAIGNNTRRRLVTESLLRDGEKLATAIHPSAIIAPSSSVGAGSMVCAAAVLNPASVIGISVILNTSCSVDHHNTIGDYAHIGPGARLGGNVTVGENSLIGIGAVVLPGIKVGARSTVAGGAIVIRDVDDQATVMGTPAKPSTTRVRS
jgi:sugar O-acyltransferase (sialic acid O-acetyltransferase NeuD family)